MILRDSTDPFDIPLDGLDGVAGYGDGRYMWSSDGWRRFHGVAIPLSIVVDARHQGDVLDVERGDALPPDCPGWADRYDRPQRPVPTIYCNRDTIRAVALAMDGRRFDWWAATLDGTLIGTAGAAAVQWRGSEMTGGHYDESIVLDASWLLGPPDQAPRPPEVDPVQLSVPILNQEARPMFCTVAGGQQHLFYVDADGKLQYVWQPPGGGPANSNWSGPLVLGEGLVPGGLVTGQVFGGMMHVYAPMPDGRALHAYTSLGSADWRSEVV